MAVTTPEQSFAPINYFGKHKDNAWTSYSFKIVSDPEEWSPYSHWFLYNNGILVMQTCPLCLWLWYSKRNWIHFKS